MAKTYPITAEQKRFLESFRCERLKADPTNRWLIQDFYHPDGEGLVNKIKRFAWDEDHLGKTAYYVIKNANGQIVMVFSLKCGTLFNPNAVAEWAKKYDNKTAREIWDEVLDPDEMRRIELSGLLDQNLPQMLKAVDEGDPLSMLNLRRLRTALGPQRYRKVILDVGNYLRVLDDKRTEPNQNIVLVPESFPAIELVEFCSNFETKDCWNKKLMGGNRMGETLFWWFIAPTMLQIGDAIGCEYVFLFAANNPEKDRMKAARDPEQEKKEKNSLVSYYARLHFHNDPTLGTAKPDYDYQCQFLCQRLRVSEDFEDPGMDSRQKHFFWSFNKDTREDPGAFDYV